MCFQMIKTEFLLMYNFSTIKVSFVTVVFDDRVSNTSIIIRRTGIRTCLQLRLKSKTGVQAKDDINTYYFHEGFTKKSKLCQPRPANSIIKWYQANSKFLLDSNLLVKPFYLTKGFETYRSDHWLYLGTVDSSLSVSDYQGCIWLSGFWFFPPCLLFSSPRCIAILWFSSQ